MKMEIVFKDGTKKIFYSVESFTVTQEQTAYKKLDEYEVAQIPIEGKLFEVDPLGIDRSCFEKPRSEWQERVRKTIQEAFEELEKHPVKYASPFYTLIPEKNWNGCKTVTELMEYANDLGGYVADWVEQALEWAQRIYNGESWEVICNNADTANWHRLVIWKNGHCRLVGDTRNSRNNYPPTDLGNGCDSDDRLNRTVPLVAFKKK